MVFLWFQYLMSKDATLCRNDPDQTFAHIIRLYYFAMNHNELYACLRVLNVSRYTPIIVSVTVI